jgi:16S rRNA (cytosine967-C5)-methyltransferase
MRPALQRTIVLDLFARVVERGELADHALRRALRAHPELHSTERRRVGDVFFSMVRLQRRLDHLLTGALQKTKLPALGTLATPEVDRLRYAAVLVLEFGENPSNAIQYSAAESRYVAALKEIAKGVTQWPTEPLQRLATKGSMPDWAAARLLAEYGDEAEALADALNVRAPLSLRVNTLKANREVLQEKLKAEGLESQLGRFSPWAVLLEGRHNVFGLDAYKAGLFEIQDEGSQLIALSTDAKPGERIIDACAGGGGKTLALAAMMNNKGTLLTCDIAPARMEDLKPRARLASVFNLQQLVVPAGPDGDGALRPWKRRADVVLVDAPCSGTGSWRRHADARWKLTEAEANAFPALQAAILDRYAETVKKGGRLIYATCSVLKAENEEVAEQFVRLHRDFVLEPLTNLPAEVLDSSGRLKTLPHRHGTDGFFAAAFRRVE